MRRQPPQFLMIVDPMADRPGVARAEWQVRRASNVPLRIIGEARTDHDGPTVTVHAAGGPTWQAGMLWAALRWSPAEGPPDLTLEWPGRPNHGTDTYATVSDALRLATDKEAQWAVRALWDALASAGRPSERADRIGAYRTAILAMHAAGWSASRITARVVLQRLGRSGDDSQLRSDVGGWAEFRAGVIRAE